MKNFLIFILQDFKNNKKNTKGKIISFFFRFGNYCNGKPIVKILLTPYILIYKLIFEWLFCIEIPYKTTIGKGFIIQHGFGIVINEKSIIGENVKIRHNVTIGNAKSNGGCPNIGDNVDIGAHSIIIGNITIGKNCIIAAGSVVINDIPDNVMVAGNPAVVKKNNIQ